MYFNAFNVNKQKIKKKTKKNPTLLCWSVWRTLHHSLSVCKTWKPNGLLLIHTKRYRSQISNTFKHENDASARGAPESGCWVAQIITCESEISDSPSIFCHNTLLKQEEEDGAHSGRRRTSGCVGGGWVKQRELMENTGKDLIRSSREKMEMDTWWVRWAEGTDYSGEWRRKIHITVQKKLLWYAALLEKKAQLQNKTTVTETSKRNAYIKL